MFIRHAWLRCKVLDVPSAILTISVAALNPLPDDTILGILNLKAFADDKLNVTQNEKVVCHRVENIVFKRLFSPEHQKSSSCGKGLSIWPKVTPPWGEGGGRSCLRQDT